MDGHILNDYVLYRGRYTSLSEDTATSGSGPSPEGAGARPEGAGPSPEGAGARPEGAGARPEGAGWGKPLIQSPFELSS